MQTDNRRESLMRGVRRLCLLIAACCWTGCGPVARASAETLEHSVMEPIDHYQTQIDIAVAAFRDIRQEDYSGLEKAMRETRKLILMGKEDPEEVVRQLVWYQAHAESLEDRMMVFFIFNTWTHDGLNEYTVASALAPYVYAPNERLRRVVRERLKIIERTVTDRYPDYSHYLSLLRGRGAAHYPDLVRYMYRSHPDDALRVMLEASRLNPEQGSKVMWAQHVIESAVWRRVHNFESKEPQDTEVASQMRLLAESEHWWVRLYAAEMMRDRLFLRKNAPIDRLKEDSHPLVRQAAEEIATEQRSTE